MDNITKDSNNSNGSGGGGDDESRWLKKWWIWLVVLILIVIVVTLSLIITGLNDDSTDSPAPTPAPTPTPTPTPTPAPTPSAATCEDRRLTSEASIAFRRQEFPAIADSLFAFGDAVRQNPLFPGAWAYPGPDLDYPIFQQALDTEIILGTQAATIFLGDSITANYANVFGSDAWSTFESAGLRPVNMGHGGDTLENALLRYRMYSGNVEFVSQATGATFTHSKIQALTPKMFVIALGTNNAEIRAHSPDELSKALMNFADIIHQDFPCASIVISGILPNNFQTIISNDDALATNDLAESLVLSRDLLNPPCLGSVEPHVVWDDFFVNGDRSTGTVDIALMPDLVHPNEAGYNTWLQEGGMLNRLVETYNRC